MDGFGTVHEAMHSGSPIVAVVAYLLKPIKSDMLSASAHVLAPVVKSRAQFKCLYVAQRTIINNWFIYAALPLWLDVKQVDQVACIGLK